MSKRCRINSGAKAFFGLTVPWVLLIMLSLLIACNGDDERVVATVVPATSTTGSATAIATPTTLPAAPATPTDAPTATAPPTPTQETATAVATATTNPASTARHRVEIDGHQIELPAGLTISIYAEDLGSPRFMALDVDGALYVTDISGGRVLKLPDRDGDGVAGETIVVVDGLNNPHGITFHDGVLYVAETQRVIRVDDTDGDGLPETVTPVIQNLPEDGQHFSRTVIFGPDGSLYVAAGASCNVCEEEDPRRAAITRYNADGGGEAIFATGLRNAVGLAFHPVTAELWATNNGADGFGDDIPAETLNLVTQDADFGWPRCHSGDFPDPDFAGGCDGVTQPAVKMQAHSAPLGLAFYTGDALGLEYTGQLFVALHGSWDRSEPVGYKVVMLPFVDGRPTGEVIDFATGWLESTGDAWGRPVDVLVAPDGSLLISDDSGGRIYRISRTTP